MANLQPNKATGPSSSAAAAAAAAAEAIKTDVLAHEITTALYHRMQGLNLPEAEIQENANTLFEFGKIAGSLLEQAGGFELPGSTEKMPFTEPLVRQIIELFQEGIYYTLQKAKALHLPADLKPMFLQNVAQHVFEQAKQVAGSTLGQELTPEFQISLEQQIELMSQAADSSLMYYVTEYEKQNGPISGRKSDLLTDMPAMPASDVRPISHEPELDPEPVLSIDEQKNEQKDEIEAALDDLFEDSIPNKPVKAETGSSSGASHSVPNPLGRSSALLNQPDEKYAAVALLLTALPLSRHAGILKAFQPAEQDRIRELGRPDHFITVCKRLDMKQLKAHVESLKRLFEAEFNRSAQDRPRLHPQLSKLVKQYSQDHLLLCLQHERPFVQQQIKTTYLATQEPALVLDFEALMQHRTKGNMAVPSFERPLSFKLQEVLQQHLKQKAKA